MTKTTLKVERHYGNKDLKRIVENLISIKLSNFKFDKEVSDKSYYSIDTDTPAIYREEDKV